eukprot:6460436-Amphidinium_carterae.1
MKLPDMTSVAQAYQAVKQVGGEEFAELQKLGRIASAAAKCNKAGGRPSFGWDRRTALRFHKKHTMDAIVSNISPLGFLDKVQAIAKHCKGNIKEALAITRKLHMHENNMKHQEEQAITQAIDEFQAHMGQAQKSLMLQALPNLSKHSINVVPGGHLQIFECEPTCIDEAISATAWSNMHDKRLAKALGEYWQQEHLLVQPDQSVPSGEANPLERTACQEAGVCICSSAGMLLKRLWAKLKGILKQTFAVPASKTLLASGRVVLHVSSADGLDSHYWSVALMYWTPYRPTFQELQVVE